MPGHWTFTNSNPCFVNPCVVCGKKVNVVRGKLEWSYVFEADRKAPMGQKHRGKIIGFVHTACWEGLA